MTKTDKVVAMAQTLQLLEEVKKVVADIVTDDIRKKHEKEMAGSVPGKAAALVSQVLSLVDKLQKEDETMMGSMVS
jgi:hypothetical protein